MLLFNTSTGEKTKEIKLLRPIIGYTYINLLDHEVLRLIHNRWILIDTYNAIQVYDTQTDKLSLIPQEECMGGFKWTSLKDGSFIQKCTRGGSKHFYLEAGSEFKLGKSQKIDFRRWMPGQSTQKAYSMDEENLLIWDLTRF